MALEMMNVAKVATYYIFDEEGHPEDGWLEHVYVDERILPDFMAYLRKEGVKHDDPEIGIFSYACADPTGYVSDRLERMRNPVTRAEERTQFIAYSEQSDCDGA